MLCFICLVENRPEPAKSITWVNGTSVCHEHLTSVGNADVMSMSYKLRGFSQRLRERSDSKAASGNQREQE